MRGILLIVFWGLFSNICFANATINVDSLKTVEQTFDVVYRLANHHYNEQEDSLALLYTNEALDKVSKDEKGIHGQLLFWKAMLTYYSGEDYELTLELFKKAETLYVHAAPNFQFSFYKAYGSACITLQEYDDGIKLLEKAIEIGQENNPPNWSDKLLNIYSNLLAAAQSKEDYTLALEYARKGIDISKNSKNYELRGNLHYNNANIFWRLNQSEKAHKEFLKALNFFEEVDNAYGLSSVNLALGEWYSHHKKYSDAQTYFEKAQQYAKRGEDYRTLAAINQLMAVNYHSQGQYDTALKYINKSLNYFIESNDSRGVSGGYYEKAKILFGKKDYEKAIESALKEINNGKQINSFLYRDESYLLLSQIEQSRGNYQQALVYHEQFVNAKDSVYNANLENKLAEEGTKQNIEAAQEAQKNAELQAQLLTSRNQLFGAIALGLLAIILVGSYLFRQLQKARKQLEAQNSQLMQLNETKDKFFGIIAHDIRSPIMALDSVGEQMNYYLSKNNEQKLRRLADRVDTTAKRLTNLLDNLLNWALLQTGMIPYHPKSVNLKSISEEILALYEPVATTKKIKLENNISVETMVYADERALSTIIRNLVNNALKFTPENGVIRISGVIKTDKIFIEINDTGTGISAEKLPKLFALERNSTDGTAGEKGSGLGLMLCKELVELNKGTIKAISELGKGSTFIFSVPQLP